jgi:hypothetical protein
VTYNRRIGPDLDYFRSGRANLSVIASKDVATMFKLCLRGNNREEVRGIGGALYSDGDLGNFESIGARSKALKFVRAFGDRPYGVVPLENSIITIGQRHVVFVSSDTGRSAFTGQRERLRSRHMIERRMLFPPARFEWSDRIDGERFELLARDLLEREPDVIRVRRAGPTREGDAGRDLICERIRTATPEEVPNSEASPSHQERGLLPPVRPRKSTFFDSSSASRTARNRRMCGACLWVSNAARLAYSS